MEEEEGKKEKERREERKETRKEKMGICLGWWLTQTLSS